MKHQEPSSYARLATMALFSFAAMYILMYAMVDSFDHVYPNVNQLYMAGLMTAAMVVLELLLMRHMYRNRRANAAIVAGSTLALIGFFALIRMQSVVHDRQFLKSMIPHHASALLMCERASLDDPELQSLCASIVDSQEGEIEQMQAMLREHRR
jgi:uncharacterized protein (DUF305 family)